MARGLEEISRAGGHNCKEVKGRVAAGRQNFHPPRSPWLKAPSPKYLPGVPICALGRDLLGVRDHVFRPFLLQIEREIVYVPGSLSSFPEPLWRMFKPSFIAPVR
jgi:hypothetical protein